MALLIFNPLCMHECADPNATCDQNLFVKCDWCECLGIDVPEIEV